MRILTGYTAVGVSLRLGNDSAFKGDKRLDTGGEEGDAMIKKNVTAWGKMIANAPPPMEYVTAIRMSSLGTVDLSIHSDEEDENFRYGREDIEGNVHLEQEDGKGTIRVVKTFGCS